MSNERTENKNIAKEICPLEDSCEERHKELYHCVTGETGNKNAGAQVKHPLSALWLCLDNEDRVVKLLLESEYNK